MGRDSKKVRTNTVRVVHRIRHNERRYLSRVAREHNEQVEAGIYQQIEELVDDHHVPARRQQFLPVREYIYASF